MELLKQSIRQMINISDEEMNTFLSFCKRKSFPRKAYLSDSGQSIKEIFFIEKGIIRVLITDIGGTEHTTHFAIEHQYIADYSAFLTQQKSKYQLQAMEDSDTIILTKEAIDWGYKNLQEGEKMGRLIAEFYFIYLDTRIQNSYTLTPKQRYDLMSTIFPNIHNRVPQHMIASYIGVTPVHLSRLKKANRQKL